MNERLCAVRLVLGVITISLLAGVGVALGQPAGGDAEPVKVYVPYEKLKSTFESEKQGIFLPYADFQRLWQAAQGKPAAAAGLPAPFILSTARFSGKVGAELATLQLELTIDILTDDWVDVPLGLGEVAVTKATFDEKDTAKSPGTAVPGLETAPPLLRVMGGQYTLLTKGKGRRVLHVDFVRQLVTRPGLNVLSLKTPPAVITTLDLIIPDENMKVDVTPMLAATTSQVDQDGKKVTKLQAFLGAGGAVEASWKPTTQAAEELVPVVISDQVQHIHVAEALISYDVTINFDIRRRGLDTFTVQLPGDFRVTGVDGANISKWDIATTQPSTGGGTGRQAASGTQPARRAGAAGAGIGPQVLNVKLFTPVKDKYQIVVKMERFLQDNQALVKLSPIVTQQALGSRQTGLLAISRTPRRSVELRDAKNLARVDVGRLPDNLRALPDIVNYRFITTDYAGTLAIDMVEPRIFAQHLWLLAVDADRMELQGQLAYNIERVGVFQLAINLPELPVPWEVLSVGPADLVERHELVGKGKDRVLNVLFRTERTGPVNLTLAAQAPRSAADSPVQFVLPLADAKNLQQFRGQVVLLLAEQLRAEVEQPHQLNPLPLNQVNPAVAIPANMRNLSPAMAYEFQTIDRTKTAAGQPAGATFKIAVKPAQVSAVVDRLVNIQPGSIQQEALVTYHVQYAPVDTFYVKMPAALADAGVEISGANIKEKPRIKELPADQTSASVANDSKSSTAPKVTDLGGDLYSDLGSTTATGRPGLVFPIAWAYYKIVLQAPLIGDYQLQIHARRSFLTGGEASPNGKPKANEVVVDPILAAGRLSDQNGHIAIAKADTLAIGEPKASKNLISGDPGSPADLPVASHRAVATFAFRYDEVPWELSLPVVVQKEADVFTVIVTTAIIEQVIARDGRLNTHATFMLLTSRGDRMLFTLPAGAEKRLDEVKLNGSAAPLEEVPGEQNTRQRIVRLPTSAGQATRSVLEITYGLEDAGSKFAGRELTAPTLPDQVPVQQTIWRVWLPDNDLLLGHSPAFGQLSEPQAEHLIAALADHGPEGHASSWPGGPDEPGPSRPAAGSGQGAAGPNVRTAVGGGPAGVQWAFAGQGRPVTFLRQGPPDKLTLWLAPRQMFAPACWGIVLLLGLILLAVGGYGRSLIILLLALGVLIARLYAPLLVDQFATAATPAVVLVALIWLAQWIFVRSRRATPAAATRGPSAVVPPNHLE